MCGESECDIVEVGQLQLLSDVLSPCGIEGHQFWEEVGAHGSFDHVGVMEWFLTVVAFHAAAGSLDVLAVVHQNLIQFFVFVADLLPVVDHSCPVDDSRVGEQLGHGEDPSVCLPSDVGDGILDEPEEILEASFLVSFVDALLAQSELLQLPVILFSHGSGYREGYLYVISSLSRPLGARSYM